MGLLSRKSLKAIWIADDKRPVVLLPRLGISHTVASD
jgi:hypothetical protein